MGTTPAPHSTVGSPDLECPMLTESLAYSCTLPSAAHDTEASAGARRAATQAADAGGGRTPFALGHARGPPRPLPTGFVLAGDHKGTPRAASRAGLTAATWPESACGGRTSPPRAPARGFLPGHLGPDPRPAPAPGAPGLPRSPSLLPGPQTQPPLVPHSPEA